MKFVVGLTVLVACAAAVEYGTEKCPRAWRKIGCFKDKIIPSRPLPESLLNRRDPINNLWDGKLLNWRDYGTTLHALACRCAALAKERGHTVFGLQFYGECWSGKDALFQYNRDGEADESDCVGIDYQTCDDKAESECVGKAFTNYIYKIEEGGSNENNKIDGNWGEWTMWTACSRTCAGGVRFRERACDNPPPSNGGKACQGEGEAEEECNTEACQPVCAKKLDVGIILDGSTSVTSKNWHKTLDFIKSFAKEFSVSKEEVHFGVLHFAWRVFMDFKISDQEFWNQDALANKVSSIRYPYGGTRTDLALTSARNNFFCEKECGNRKGVPKVLLVLTDGKSSYNAQPVKEAAQPMKDAGVTILSIGVGSADEEELKEMATDDSHVFMLSQYNYLMDKLNQILKLACESAGDRRRRRRR